MKEFNLTQEIKDIAKELEDFMRNSQTKTDWYRIRHWIFSEDFLREFQNQMDFKLISEYQILSEDFIREFHDRVDWDMILRYQPLSESFIREFQDRYRLDREYILKYQPLSESFIREFMTNNRIPRYKKLKEWEWISVYQSLSEDFIREFQNQIDWPRVSLHQVLSENFIREFQDRVNWDRISIYQSLSEDFIKEFQDKMSWSNIFQYQVLSESFIKEFQDEVQDDLDDLDLILKYTWLYKDTSYKKQQLLNTNAFETYDDYFIGYKAVRRDLYPFYKFFPKYEIGSVVTNNADHTSFNPSHGLHVTTRKEAIQYARKDKNEHNFLLIKVKVDYKDIARVLRNHIVRCTKLEVLEIVGLR